MRIIFSALILTVGSTFGFANSDESFMTVIADTNASVFRVVYKSKTAHHVKVSIINSKNEVVFSESFRRINRFARPYNFVGLPEGEYTIEINDNHGKKVEKVIYSLGVVKSLVKVSKLSDQGKFLLSVANEGMNVINVTIYNAEGEQLIYNAHIVDGDFAIVYNLLKAGAYTFVVSDKDGKSNTIVF